MTEAPFIGFEGPIGAGKTTLAGRLAKHTGYDLVLEKFNENDYLADFYSDQLRWALPMQLWFLAERHQQLAQITRRRRTPYIADYTALKNEVFSSLLLNGRDLRLYTSLAASLTDIVRKPTLIVYLDAVDSVLLERIAQRGRAYEAHIDAHYLQAVRQSYEDRLDSVIEDTVMRYDTSALDLSSRAQMSAFYESVLKAAKGGASTPEFTR